MKILGLCGSLRKDSSNALLLQAAESELKTHQWFHFEISKLPYFDPDLQYSEQTPKAVMEVRSFASQADVIFVCTPEYAHGIPGILKNAFEWIFHEGTLKKPVYTVIGSSQGENTKSQLIEILTTMDFSINEQQTLIVKGARSAVDSTGHIAEPILKNTFSKFCHSLSK